MAAVVIGFSFQLPLLFLIIILLSGALFGAFYAFIAGCFQAATGGS